MILCHLHGRHTIRIRADDDCTIKLVGKRVFDEVDGNVDVGFLFFVRNPPGVTSIPLSGLIFKASPELD
jgi:hypothetical protein